MSVENIYQQIKGQSQNLGTAKTFETGAAGTKEGGLGSVDAVIRDMAERLSDAGLTSIEQLGQRRYGTYYPEVIQSGFRGSVITPTGRWYNYPYKEAGEGGSASGIKNFISADQAAGLGLKAASYPKTYAEMTSGESNFAQTVPVQSGGSPMYFNKNTGQLIPQFNNAEGGGWARNTAGDGQTVYGVKFDPTTGLPIFVNAQTHGIDEYADLLKIAAIGTAIFAPQIGAALLPAGSSAAAALAVGSAVSGFIGSGGNLEAGIKAGLAGYLGGQAGSWASKTANSALVGNIASNMTRTAILGGDMEQALVASLVQGAPAIISQNFPNFAQLPRAAQEAAVAATVDLMRTGGDNLEQIALQGATKGATDYALGQIDGYKDLRPAQKEIIRNGVSNTLGGASLSNELLQGAISFGQEAVQNEVNNEKAKKDGWADYATQQAAQSLYGSKVTPDLYADKQDTTEAEAKDIARNILNREPTEFEYMQLIGLPEREAAQNSDLAAIKYDESTFDSNELAESYKAVYGKEPTKEWLASDEAMDMLGRSDAQGRNMLQDLYTKEKAAAPTPEPLPPKQDLTQAEADQLLADLGIKTPPTSGSGTQYAQADTGTVSDAGGGSKPSVAELAADWSTKIWIDRITADSGKRLSELSPAERDVLSAKHRPTDAETQAIYDETKRLYDAGNLTSDEAVQRLFNRPVPTFASPESLGVEGVQPSGSDGDFWKDIGIDPSTFTDSSPSLSNDEIMALIGYGESANPPEDGSGRPMYGDVSGSFGGGPLTGFTLVSEANGAKVYENDGFTLLALANGSNALLDKTDPTPEPIWLDPVQLESILRPAPVKPAPPVPEEIAPTDPPKETTLDDLIKELTPTTPAEPTPPTSVEPTPPTAPMEPAPVTPEPAEPTPVTPTPVGPTPVTPVEPIPVTPTPTEPVTPLVNPPVEPTPPTGITPAEVQKIVDDALKANPNLTAADVQKIVSDAVSVIPNLTADQVKQIVGDELAKVPTAATPTDVQNAVDAAKTETAGQIADVETRLTDAIAAAEAMGLSRDQAITAAVESVAADLGTTKTDLLTQLGTTEETLRSEFTTGLAGVSAEVKAAYDSLTADQKALADQLAQQGVDLTTAIQTAQEQTQTQIGDLAADVQAKFDALTEEQKALATSLEQQGVDLNTAIETAQQQTQQQITDLGVEVDARINELMQQGQTYQQATQTAFAEVNAKNQEMAGLIGTQGRSASQQDIDALTEMLGGQRSMDLAYDVTGDKQITQADIDFLTQVVGGTKTDWTAPQQSPWSATGLYGQIQANELQRQQDLAAAEAQRVADQQAAAERARQESVRGGLRTTALQGQQQLQALQQQLPQAMQMAQTTSTPIYGEMGPYLDLGSPLDFDFFKPSPEKQAATKQAQPTKIAAGGYIDDLLAGNMTADDLLNLLR